MPVQGARSMAVREASMAACEAAMAVREAAMAVQAGRRWRRKRGGGGGGDRGDCTAARSSGACRDRDAPAVHVPISMGSVICAHSGNATLSGCARSMTAASDGGTATMSSTMPS